MASHLKGVKKSTMTDEMRKALCQYSKEHPTSTQKELQQWVSEKFDLKVSQATIPNTLKRSSKYLSIDIEKGGHVKRHKSSKFPEMEKPLFEWVQYIRRANHKKGKGGYEIVKPSRDFKIQLFPRLA